LRILDENHFDLTWSRDKWQTTHITASRSLGSAGFSADIATAPDQTGSLSWTLRWPERDHWLGYNVEVQVGSR